MRNDEKLLLGFGALWVVLALAFWITVLVLAWKLIGAIG